MFAGHILLASRPSVLRLGGEKKGLSARSRKVQAKVRSALIMRCTAMSQPLDKQ